MEDNSIFKRISDLVNEEKTLRAQRGKGEVSDREEQRRLATVQVELDQCWDLLQQRAAKREFGEDPDEATVRDASVVQNYKY